MTEQLIEEKKANALKPEARARFEDESGFVYGFGDMLRSTFGGLWVGGTISLHEASLVFRPNSVNRAAHAEDTTTVVALADVTGVTVRGGLLTKIVDVATEGEGLTFRCFGDEAFADAIRAQADQLTSSTGSA